MPSNKFDPNTDIPSLSGKIYIVTGGSAGIGFGILAHLLQHEPEKIYLISNKQEHATDAIEELKEWGDASKVEWVPCDLADLNQTEQVARGLSGRVKRLDGLMLNAGLGVGKYWETVDGLDSHFQVNFLSQMLLGLILLPVLQQTATNHPDSSPRFVMMSSDLHRAAPSSTKFASREEINEDIGPMKLYNRSKLAQVLFIRMLNRQLEAGKYGQGKIYVNATHPGGVATDQQDQAIEAYGTLGKIGVAAVKPFMKDPVKSGCRSGLFALASKEVGEEGISGEYIVPDRKVTSVSDQGADDKLAGNLWELSESLLKQSFGGKLPYEST